MSKETVKLAVEVRSDLGNNASRRLRHAGMIPAIIYGKHQEPQTVAVNADAWKVFSAQGVQMVSLVADGKETPALVREVQYNHLKNYVVHVDFQAVSLDEKIHASVAVHPFGEAYGASHGGILEQEVHELPVVCSPLDLPDSIKVDVTALNLGDALTVAQLALPEGVTAELDADTVVFHVVRPKEEAEPEAAAEGEEAAATEPEAINEKKTEARAAEKDAKEKEKK